MTETMEQAVQEVGSLEIAGRKFHVSRRMTSRQEIYVRRYQKRAGINELDSLFVPGADVADICETIVDQADERDALYPLLGGMLVEEGKKWNKVDAKRNAELFETADSPQDRALINASLVGVLLAFFVKGLKRSKISLSSLRDREEQASPSEATTSTSGNSADRSGETAAPKISESIPTS